MSTPRPFSDREVRIGRTVLKAFSKANVWVYRATGGRVGSRWMQGAPICLLTTIGRKSGEPRTTPLLYLQDDDRVLMVASQAGMPTHPLWYKNLLANPDCEVQIGSETRKMRARTASAEEKDALWPRLVEMYSDFSDYQARTERDIPVVIFEPV